MTSRRVLASLSVVLLGLAACSSDDDSSAPTTAVPATTEAAAPTTEAAPVTTEAAATTTEAAPTTTLDLAAIAATYAEPGPYRVGATTYTLPAGNQVEVWYPAVDGPSGPVTYETRDYLPEAIRALLTSDAPAGYTFDGERDAAVADGEFPLVLVSHGFAGFRVYQTFLTAHLASWGFVVASPDHPSRQLSTVLLGELDAGQQSAADDLLQTLDLIDAENQSSDGLLAAHVDTSRVVAVGHSAGGGSVLQAAADDRISGYVSMASGVFLGGLSTDDAPTDATTSTTIPTLPDKPSFFMAGSADARVPAEERTRPAFELAGTPSLLWIIDGAGHNAFDDFCTFGGGTGIIGLAEQSGLGSLLDGFEGLRSLGEDGCVPPAVPVADTFPMIRHAVTAWIRNVVGVDAEPIGIGPDFADAFAQPVEIAERP